MRKRLYVVCGLLILGISAAVCRQATAQEKKAGATVAVRVNYTGSGTVDEGHKIYVALWDSPGFTQGSATPLAVKPAASKNETVTFTDVTANPAYASAAYDPTGKWDAQSPPPSGSSLGMYSKEPGKPAPISGTAGRTARAEISFNDSFKTP